MCRKAVEHFDNLVNKDGTFVRDLTGEEWDFIENERMLCTLDFRYYLERYSTIKDRQDRLIRLVPNVAQNIMIDTYAEAEDKGHEIALIILKARQFGISTLTELVIAWFVQFHRERRAVVGSSDPDKSNLMSKIIELNWVHMPWWLMPNRTAYRVGERMEFDEQGSLVSVQHGTQFSGIGRGTTFTIAHLCLAPTTSIPMADSSIKQLRNVAQGDVVITADENIS